MQLLDRLPGAEQSAWPDASGRVVPGRIVSRSEIFAAHTSSSARRRWHCRFVLKPIMWRPLSERDESKSYSILRETQVLYASCMSMSSSHRRIFKIRVRVGVVTSHGISYRVSVLEARQTNRDCSFNVFIRLLIEQSVDPVSRNSCTLLAWKFCSLPICRVMWTSNSML